jgi:HSP20 family protein
MANALAKWHPLQELDQLQTRLSTLFGRSALRNNGDKDEAMTVAEWAPLVDIAEDDNEYVITSELPEVEKENVKVTVNHGVLSIQGERSMERKENGKKYHRVERAYGRFSRSFTLPDYVDGNRIAAEFKDGILRVHLPKSEEAKPKSIQVKIT